MKQVLMLKYKSTKCSKHCKYINGKNDHNLLTFFDPNFSRRDIKVKEHL